MHCSYPPIPQVLVPEWGEGFEMNNIQPDERCIDDNHAESDSGAVAERRPPVSVEFRTTEAVTSPTSDHDPHGAGEVPSEFVVSTCDTPGCEMSGLVSVSLLEDADGFSGWPPFDVICEDCAEAHGHDDYTF
ncbi:MAG: hypothetical protein ACI8XM_000309 [Haloarculaceae archaeon]